MRSQKDFLKIYNKIGRRFYMKIFGRSSVHFLPFDKNFLNFFKTKNKKKDQKIFRRSQKDIR